MASSSSRRLNVEEVRLKLESLCALARFFILILILTTLCALAFFFISIIFYYYYNAERFFMIIRMRTCACIIMHKHFARF